MKRGWIDTRSLLLPFFAYWGMVGLSVGLFVLLILTTEGPTHENVLAISGILVGTVVGVGLGQGMALARLRTWVALTISSVGFVVMVYGLVKVEGLGGDDLFLAASLALFCFVFFLPAGVFSLRVHMGFFATWVPMVFLVGSILLILDESGKDAAWFEGDKWAVWDVFTAPILLAGVIMLLLYLGSRELHRLHLWRYGPEGPDVPITERKQRKSRTASMLPGCGGLFLVGLLAVVLTVASALVAPYLWRSAPDEDGQPDDHPTEQMQQPPEGQPQPQPQPPPQEDQGCNKQDQQQDQGDQGEQTPQEQVVEAVQNAGISLLMLILLVFLVLAGLVIFGPPLRRTLLLHHLRRPLWPVPPTRRVRLAWRLAEIAIGDAGVHRLPSDSATSLAARAAESLGERIDPEPILVVAEIADRVLYGLGLRPDDTDKATRLAEMAYQAVWEGLSEGEKFKAVYRLL